MAHQSFAVTFVVGYRLADGRERSVVLAPRAWSQFGAWRRFARARADAPVDDLRTRAVVVADDLTCLTRLLCSQGTDTPSPRVYRTSVEIRAALTRRLAHEAYEAALDCAQLAVRWRLDANGRLRQRLRHVVAEGAVAFAPWFERVWPDADTEAIETTLRVALEAGVDLREDDVQARVGFPALDVEKARCAIDAVAREALDRESVVDLPPGS
jgi:hypothetical protein